MARLRPSFWRAFRSRLRASASGPFMVTGRCSRDCAISFHIALEILSRIGAVEGLIAEGEIRHDVAFDRCLQQRPLEPGGIARVAADDAALRIESDPGHDLA